jgi:hypothetical protein
MPQVFHRSANTAAKWTLLGGPVFLVAGLWGVHILNTSNYLTRQGMYRQQPIPFSHKHHVEDDGLDCRYCHTSVETSPFAGIPSTHVCMTCHSQIWAESAMLAPVHESYRTDTPIQWVRVNDLPDYVYFDHSIHVNKGVACIMCHGEVNKMPLTYQAKSLRMKWCLSCHREPERFVRPREHVFDMEWVPPRDQLTMGRNLVKEYKIQKLTDCYTCHR